MCYTTLTKGGRVDVYWTLSLLIWFVSIWSKLPGSSTKYINYLTLGYVFPICCCHWKRFYQTSVPTVLQKVVGMPSYLKVVCNHSPRNYWLLSAITIALISIVVVLQRNVSEVFWNRSKKHVFCAQAERHFAVSSEHNPSITMRRDDSLTVEMAGHRTGTWKFVFTGDFIGNWQMSSGVQCSHEVGTWKYLGFMPIQYVAMK